MTDLQMIAGNTACADPETRSIMARVCAYWSGLRQNGAVPRRASIDPQALGAALPHVFLAELVTPRVARLRLCGNRIEALMGMDMRGMPLSVLFQGAARDDLAEAVEQTATGARVILSLQSDSGFGQPKANATLALMPLADEAGQLTRLLGVLEKRSDTLRTPCRFTLARPVFDDAIPARPVLRVITGGRR